MKIIIYAEDNQMYYTNFYLVKTNFTGDLEALSWTPVEAGRVSTSVRTLQNLVKALGLKFKIIKNLGENIPKEYEDLIIVKGATGNY